MHALFAGGVELSDAVALDVGLATKAKCLFDFDLDGQPMGVPTATGTDDVLTAHTVIADDDIFGDARLDVVNAGTAIGRRWAFVEDEWFVRVTVG